jgi:Fe-S-cluster containining protein
MNTSVNNSLKLNDDDYAKHLTEITKDHLPAVMKLVMSIRDEFLEIQAKDGTLSAVLSAYQTIDTILAEDLPKCEQPVSCYNCTKAHCCHQTVDICEAEATVIAQYCKENRIKISRKYLQKQLTHRGDQISYKDCSACVFLKENRCSIYPVRPFECRTYHVFTSIEFCDTKKHKGHRVGRITNTMSEFMKGAVAMVGGKTGRMPKLLLKYSN